VSPPRTSRQPNKATATIISFSVKCLQASSSRRAPASEQASKPASKQTSQPAPKQQARSRQAAAAANSKQQQTADCGETFKRKNVGQIQFQMHNIAQPFEIETLYFELF
jgi:hypothetical protein